MLQQPFAAYFLKRTLCHDWYRRFKSVRSSLEGDPKSVRYSTLTDDDHVEIVLAVFRQNRHVTLREVVQEAAICKCFLHLILAEEPKNGRVVPNLSRIC